MNDLECIEVIDSEQFLMAQTSPFFEPVASSQVMAPTVGSKKKPCEIANNSRVVVRFESGMNPEVSIGRWN